MAATRDMLGTLGVSDAAARIFRYFLIRPTAHPHARELQRTLDLGGASIQRELERMIELGALEKSERAGRTQYWVVEDAPIWKAVRILTEASTDPRSLLQDALVDVSGVHAAFIFGSSATGAHRPDSDVDVLVVEESAADPRTLHRNLAEVGMLLGRGLVKGSARAHAKPRAIADERTRRAR